MRKALMLGLALGILVFLAGSADAYYYDYGAPHGTRVVFGFDGDFYTQDYRYVDYYGVPVYRVYEPRSDSRFFDDDDFWEYVNKRRAARFVVSSYNDRYDITAGRSSGDAFCSGCRTDGVASNWGNRPAYNWLADGPGDSTNYYYRQSYDNELQRFNWRF